MESNEWEKENTDIWGISREKTEFLFNNTIKVLLEDEKKWDIWSSILWNTIHLSSGVQLKLGLS